MTLRLLGADVAFARNQIGSQPFRATDAVAQGAASTDRDWDGPPESVAQERKVAYQCWSLIS